MSRQDKATTERFTRTLRELVKRPENKLCGDCKRNDPRWASWNLGVFLCIRCSGIHRGMGTHISKVKSVDLDVWTPEQMESIQKWGNRLANLYWEAHLKQGHVPPEHKMESFIRSKYESRRWALEGPLPKDPSVLDSGDGSASLEQPPQPTQIPRPPLPLAEARASRASHVANNSVSSRLSPAPGRSSQQHQLLSAGLVNQPPSASRASVPAPAAQQQAQAQAAQPPQNDLFSLDFHSPAISTPRDASSPTQQPPKDVKSDIMSLFSSNAPAATPVNPAFGQFSGNQFGAAVPQASPWGAPQPQAAPAAAAASSQWGSAGWGNSAPAPPPAQGNLWGAAAPTQAQTTNLFASSNDVWGGGAAAPAAGLAGGAAGGDLFGSFAGSSAQQKKDDAFGDLWGGFK